MNSAAFCQNANAGLYIELAKAYLHRILNCIDSAFNNSVRCLSHVYLAALYYWTRQYETARDHCNVVATADSHSHCSSHVVHRQLVPPIDDNIDSVIGLVVLYQYVQTAALNQQHRHAPFFTAHLFACFIQLLSTDIIRPRTVKEIYEMNQTMELYQHCKSITNDPLATDVLLYRLCREKHPVRPTIFSLENSSPQLTHRIGLNTRDNTADLTACLKASAVEYMRSFRRTQKQQFGLDDETSDCTMEAVYAFCCARYEQCLAISRYNWRALAFSKYVVEFLLSHVNSLALLNGYVTSVLGLTIMRYKYTPLTVSPFTLMLYLRAECEMKLRKDNATLRATLKIVKTRHCAPQCQHRVLDRILLEFIFRKIVLFTKRPK